MKLDRRVIEAAEREAERYGLRCAWVFGGKHPILTLRLGDSHRKIAIAGSPRTGRDHQADWVRQDVRRLAKQLQDDEARSSTACTLLR